MFATDVKVLDVETQASPEERRLEGRRAPEHPRPADRRAQPRDLAGRRPLGPEGRAQGRGDRRADHVVDGGLRPLPEGPGAEYEKFYYGEALKSLEQAVELDPEFAVAYLVLARVHGAWTIRPRLEMAYRKPRPLSERAPEKERLYIEAAYAGAVEMNPKRPSGSSSGSSSSTPRKRSPTSSWATLFRNKMQFPAAIDEYEQAAGPRPELRIRPEHDRLYLRRHGRLREGDRDTSRSTRAAFPGDANPLDSLAETYFRMGDLDRAVATYKKALDDHAGFLRIALGARLSSCASGGISGVAEGLDRYIAGAPSMGMKGTGHLSGRRPPLLDGRHGRGDLRARENGEPGGLRGIRRRTGLVALPYGMRPAPAETVRRGAGRVRPLEQRDEGLFPLQGHGRRSSLSPPHGVRRSRPGPLEGRAARGWSAVGTVHSEVSGFMKPAIGVLHDRLQGESPPCRRRRGQGRRRPREDRSPRHAPGHAGHPLPLQFAVPQG